jgi:hypothetical protein
MNLNPKIAVEPTETVPDDASVRDFDELEWPAKRQFATVVGSGERRIDEETALQFTDGEFVKYTGYYRVLLA